MTRSRLAYAALTLFTLGLWAVMSLWSLPLVATEADGLTPFDLRPFGYDQDAVEAFMNALSAEGRAFYTDVQHRLDTVFPAAVGLWLAMTLWHVLAHWPVWARLALVCLSLAGAVSDYVENARVAEILAVNTPTGPMVAAASQATMLKSACITFLMLLLVWALGRRLWGRVFG